MRRRNSEIITDFVSERGYENTNRTYFAFVPLEGLACYAAAESWDMDAEINSAKLAVESVLTAFERKPSLNNIRSYIRYAHGQLRRNSVKSALEAAVTVVVTDYTRIRYAVCGNVKFYLLSGNGFYLKSEDQTYFQYAAQRYGKDKAPKDENRNLIQYLGKPVPPRPFVSKKIKLPEGSTMALATCGLWERIHEIEVADAYESSAPEELAGNIEELYLGYQTGGSVRSYTLATMFVKKTYKEDDAKRKKRFKILLIIALVLAGLLIIGAIVYSAARFNDRNAMAEISALDADGVRYSNYGNYARAFERYESALALAQKLNMKNWQYIDEKTELSRAVSDRWLLFKGIADGESYMETGDYMSASRAFQSVESVADSDLQLLLSDYLDERISQAELYLEIYDDITLGEIYDLAGMYADARLVYNEANAKARSIGDLALRKEILLLLLDLDEKDGERAAAAESERDREINAAVQPDVVAAAEAALSGQYDRALELYDRVLRVYRQNDVQDDRFLNILVEIDKVREKKELEEQEALEAQAALEAQGAQPLPGDPGSAEAPPGP